LCLQIPSKSSEFQTDLKENHPKTQQVAHRLGLLGRVLGAGRDPLVSLRFGTPPKGQRKERLDPGKGLRIELEQNRTVWNVDFTPSNLDYVADAPNGQETTVSSFEHFLDGQTLLTLEMSGYASIAVHMPISSSIQKKIAAHTIVLSPRPFCLTKAARYFGDVSTSVDFDLQFTPSLLVPTGLVKFQGVIEKDLPQVPRLVNSLGPCLS
jgi:hypothetical protein